MHFAAIIFKLMLIKIRDAGELNYEFLTRLYSLHIHYVTRRDDVGDRMQKSY
jgi:hypothetical protein